MVRRRKSTFLGHEAPALTGDEMLCPHCISLTAPTAFFCGECALRRPESGWHVLHEEHDPWLGEVVADRYVVRQRLGVGGTARVYRVHQAIEPVRLALKIVELDANRMGDADVAEQRVRREFMMVGGLRNPHIVPIYEFLRPSPRTVGFVMAYADGLTLQEWIVERGPLDVELALNVARQVATGLAEAHAAGIVHRDIKPENLMMQELGGGEVLVRIMDFGIAQWGDHGSLTRGFIGTPLYASPEQIMGDPAEPASDAYSIGTTLYAALTGVPPFRRSTPIDILRAQVLDSPPRLSEATTEFFSPELEQFVALLLRKRASDRPQSMAEVIDQIDLLREAPGFSDVIVGSPRETSELLEVSETIAGTRETNDEAQAVDEAGAESSVGSIGLISNSGSHIVSLRGDDVVVRTIDEPTEQRVRCDDAELASALAASPKQVFVGTRDGRLLARGAEDRAWSVEFESPTHDGIASIGVTADGDGIVLGTFGGDVYVRHQGGDWQQLDHDMPVRAVAISPHGATVAIAAWCQVTVLDLDSKDSVAIEELGVIDVCFSEDEYLLATLTRRGRVAIRGLAAQAEPRLIHSSHQDTSSIRALHFTPQSLFGVRQDDDGVVLVDLQREHA